MSDSTDTTKELDNYGVWVKTPPKDASQANDETDFQLDTDLPDFSDLDLNASDDNVNAEPEISEDFNFDSLSEDTTAVEEPATVAEETDFSDITDFGTTDENSVISEISDDISGFEEVSINTDTISSEGSEGSEELSIDDFMSDSSESSGDEEISLDDFMDGGFTDPNPGAAPAESPASTMEDGEISLDDFFDDDTSTKEKEDDVSNDEALDIDLSFTDEEVPTVEESEIIDETPAADEGSTESSDFSEAVDFDDMFGAAEGSESSSSAGETEISVDDFGFSDSAVSSSSSGSSSEEVDLSDFGIDSDAEETAVHQDVQAAKKNLVVDYDLSISDEDQTEEMQVSSTVPEKTENTVAVPENSSIVSNSILEQIMTELSGLKSEINNLKTDFETLKNQEPAAADVAVERPAEEIVQPEINEEASLEIPESSAENISETPADENFPLDSMDEIQIPMPEQSEDSNGFFGTDDEDDTIALSGDELNNIMNTADFAETEETVESTDSVFEESNEPEVAEESTIDFPTEEQTVDTMETNEVSDDFELPADETEANTVSDDISDIDVSFDNLESPDEEIAIDETLEEPVLEDVATEEITEEPADDELALPEESETVIETAEEPAADDFALPEESEAVIETAEEPAADDFALPEESEPVIETAEEPAADDFALPEESDAVIETAEESAADELALPEESEPVIEAMEEPASETVENTEIDNNFTDDNPFGSIDESAMDVSIEETDSGLSIEENSENLEEPDFESFENQEIESEITIPKVDDLTEKETAVAPEDDILVESSNDDFMDSVAESEMEITQSESEPAAETIEIEENIDVVEEIPETVDLTPEVDNNETDSDEVSNVEPFNDSTDNLDSNFDSMLDTEELSDENVDYLKSDESVIENDMESIASVMNEEMLSDSMNSNIDATVEDPFPPIESVMEQDERVERQELSETLISMDLKNDIKSVLLYMDQLLENLPEDKIMEFAKSEHFGTYKRLFNELGLS